MGAGKMGRRRPVTYHLETTAEIVDVRPVPDQSREERYPSVDQFALFAFICIAALQMLNEWVDAAFQKIQKLLAKLCCPCNEQFHVVCIFAFPCVDRGQKQILSL